MRHKGLVLSVSVVLGLLVFIVVWLFTVWADGGVVLAIISGILTFISGLLLAGGIYWRSSQTLTQLEKELEADNERVLYSDIASFVKDGHEYTGALFITGRRFLFQTPPRRKKAPLRLEYTFYDIAMAKNVRGYFRMAAGGLDNRFKVFRCDELVQLVQAGVSYAMAQRAKAAEAQANAPKQPEGEAQTLPEHNAQSAPISLNAPGHKAIEMFAPSEEPPPQPSGDTPLPTNVNPQILALFAQPEDAPLALKAAPVPLALAAAPQDTAPQSDAQNPTEAPHYHTSPPNPAKPTY